VIKNRLCNVQWFVFFEFLTLFILRGHNFPNSTMFLMRFSVSHVLIEGFKFCLDTRNNGALPLDPAYPECLSGLLTGYFTLV